MDIKRIFTLTIVVVSAALKAWGGYTVAPVESGGWITGKINYSGIPPAAKKVSPTSDKAVCGRHGPILSEELMVSPDSGLQNAVVYITNITSGKPLSVMAVPILEQDGCTFHPHVLVVPVGKSLTIRNNDSILHNIHTHSLKNRAINIGQAAVVPEISIGPYRVTEVVKVTCDVHAWMSAWLWVTDHPYAVVTGPGGRYKITEVPPGEYLVETWSETLGKVSGEVTVVPGKEAHLDLIFPAAQPTVQMKKGK
jgi:hypothetical protein